MFSAGILLVLIVIHLNHATRPKSLTTAAEARHEYRQAVQSVLFTSQFQTYAVLA